MHGMYPGIIYECVRVTTCVHAHDMFEHRRSTCTRTILTAERRTAERKSKKENHAIAPKRNHAKALQNGSPQKERRHATHDRTKKETMRLRSYGQGCSLDRGSNPGPFAY